MRDDYDYEAASAVREQLISNTKEAAKMQRLLTSFGVDLANKKIAGIKALRDQLSIDLRSAKDAWELAYELRAA